MRRLIDWHLFRWKEATERKPLLIRGARQVGKTFAVRALGKRFPSMIEVNFERNPQHAKLFASDLDPKPHLYFWCREARGSQAEVDYLF